MSIQFIQKINHKTGERTWEVAEDDYDLAQELARSRFADMILDYDRNNKFLAGLKSVISEKKALGEQVHVLDIGTGTGLLSLMAAREGADRVTALEVFKPMAKCAKEIIANSEFSDKIQVIDTRSTDLDHLTTKPNVIVAEVFDTELIGEGALRTFKEALTNLVEPGCRVIPSRGRVFVQPVSSDFLRKFNEPPLLDNGNGKDGPIKCPGTAAVFDVQLSRMKLKDFKTLTSNAIHAFDFNFEDPNSIEYDEIRQVPFECNVASGSVDALLMWWDLNMDGNHTGGIDMAPEWYSFKKYHWRDHWMQAVYYLPEKVYLKYRQHYVLNCAHDEFSMWFSIGSTPLPRPYCTCEMHNHLSRTSIYRLSQTAEDEKLYRKLEQICRNHTVVAFGEGSLIGLIATNFAKNVQIVESNTHFRTILMRYIQHYNMENKVTIVSQLSELTEKPDLVIGEPSYVSSGAPWENLRFWYDCDQLKKMFDDNQIPVYPNRAVLTGVPMKFKHLHKIACEVGTVNGFDLSIFDRINQKARSATDSLIDEHSLWEYDGIATSLPQLAVKFDLTKAQCRVSCEMNLTIPSHSNAYALWMDWYMDDTCFSSGPLDEIISGQEPSWNVGARQGVFFLTHELTGKDELRAKVEYDPDVGDICFQFK